MYNNNNIKKEHPDEKGQKQTNFEYYHIIYIYI